MINKKYLVTVRYKDNFNDPKWFNYEIKRSADYGINVVYTDELNRKFYISDDLKTSIPFHSLNELLIKEIEQ